MNRFCIVSFGDVHKNRINALSLVRFVHLESFQIAARNSTFLPFLWNIPTTWAFSSYIYDVSPVSSGKFSPHFSSIASMLKENTVLTLYFRDRDHQHCKQHLLEAKVRWSSLESCAGTSHLEDAGGMLVARSCIQSVCRHHDCANFSSNALLSKQTRLMTESAAMVPFLACPIHSSALRKPARIRQYEQAGLNTVSTPCNNAPQSTS